jgi:crossover junction endodeoxyribonuclease RuvC
VKVLGVDPGTARLGWGIVVRDGARLRGVDAGVLHLDDKSPLEDRLAVAYEKLVEIARAEAVEVFAVEDVFYAKFPRAAIALGHVRGVVLLAARHAGAVVHAYPPAVVKRAVAGGGGADKAQVARMVGAILGWKTLPAIDATDALAVAITHLHAAPAIAARVAAAERVRSARRR